MTSKQQVFDPPRPLDPVARAVWDRQAQRLYRDGRWHGLDHDLVCLFAETTSMYLQLKADIDQRGMLVKGRGDVAVRHPGLTPLAQARADMLRIAKAIPLAVPAAQADNFGAEVDRLLDEIR
ncbi:P27 family phage terminase small subunit [Mycobacterium sp.]|uniref:P27 family phage terminase small subunit n=1 Tax=Mycobacterium sp. TaxID=1785 RepID=UPI003F9A1BD7